MKFIADVNIAQKVIRLLCLSGHDVIDIKKLNSITPDTKIIELALEEKIFILTHDKDFLGLTKFPKFQSGMIVIRLRVQNATHHWQQLEKVLNENSQKILLNSLTIINEESVEIFSFQRPKNQ